MASGQRRFALRLGIGVFLAIWVQIPLALAVPYTFTKVIDNSGSFSGIGLFPTINDNGSAVFFGVNTQGEGIFAGNGGPLTTIASDASDPAGGFLTSAGYGPKINDSGRATFAGNLPGKPVRVFSGTGGPLTPIAGPPDYEIDQGIPAINNAGLVAFGAVSTIPGVGGGIFVGNGAAVTKIAPGAGPFNSIDSRPAINDSGQVAFNAFDASGQPLLYRADTATATIVADRTMFPFGPGSSFGTPDLNNAGVVAFVGAIAIDNVGVFKADGQSITTVLGNSGPLRASTFHGVAINNLGDVAFAGIVGSGNDRGIFTGPNPVSDKVIRFGDPLFGSTVALVEITHGALNDSGQIAFRYELADSITRGVAIATPVPEPVCSATILLAVLACLPRRSHR